MYKMFLIAVFVFLLIACDENMISDDRKIDIITRSDPKGADLVIDPHPNQSHLINETFATPEHPVTSPSGIYTMVIESGYDEVVYYNRFTIYKTEDDTLLFSSPATFRTRDRLWFTWDEYDNVWIVSGDRGVFWWEKEDDVWVNHNKKIAPEDYQGLFEK